MSSSIKSPESILAKLGIQELNPMQEQAGKFIRAGRDMVLLSPTGTGKTLAFLLPALEQIDPDNPEIQVLILVPSRELALQIEMVVRNMGAGIKTNALYGGREGTKDKADLVHPPAILIGTPGRIADHIRRESFALNSIKTIILDEFDKSLEIGFEVEMGEIFEALPNLQQRILTSASQKVKVPEFVGLKDYKHLNFLGDGVPLLKIRLIRGASQDKMEVLSQTLSHLGNQPGIIFCNLKDTIKNLSEYLQEKNIAHGCFSGDMEQIDRERALIKFRNGTHQLLVATDLAARGIDVPELKFIIHYELPPRDHEFNHRNGRTARMNTEGTAYVIESKEESLPGFIEKLFPKIMKEEILKKAALPKPSPWVTLYISGGRKDKISKGDIVGLFLKQGKLDPAHLGVIEVKTDCAYVGVHKSSMGPLLPLINNTKLKNKKVRVSLL
jgi:superfamily II DNA/RNA helicase